LTVFCWAKEKNEKARNAISKKSLFFIRSELDFQKGVF